MITHAQCKSNFFAMMVVVKSTDTSAAQAVGEWKKHRAKADVQRVKTRIEQCWLPQVVVRCGPTGRPRRMDRKGSRFLKPGLHTLVIYVIELGLVV